MLIRYYTELPLPVDEVRVRLLGAPESWLPELAQRADEHGRRLFVDVGLGKRARVHRKVEVEVGNATQLGTSTHLPVHWEVRGAEQLFPSLDADLEVGGLGPASTQLAISARYEPPLGLVGWVADRMLMYRIAEATVRDFVDRVGARLVSPAPSGQRTPGL